MHIVQYCGDIKRLMWTTGPYIYAASDLPVEARVLEVGGGSDPHPAANVIVEKYMTDNTHRVGQSDLVKEGVCSIMDAEGKEIGTERYAPEIVQADVVDMPFNDGEFDFVICKDVLEHVDDIQAAARELSRVAKAGFVDVPKVTSEMLWPQKPGVHLWVFEYTQPRGGLIAHRIQFESPFGDLLHKAFSESVELQAAWAASRFFFHCVHFWEGALRIEVGEPIGALR